MDSGLEEEEATPQQEIENNGASFKAMCDQFWTTLCGHKAFENWPMGPPGSSEAPAAARLHNAQACSRRVQLWLSGGQEELEATAGKELEARAGDS